MTSASSTAYGVRNPAFTKGSGMRCAVYIPNPIDYQALRLLETANAQMLAFILDKNNEETM